MIELDIEDPFDFMLEDTETRLQVSIQPWFCEDPECDLAHYEFRPLGEDEDVVFESFHVGLNRVTKEEIFSGERPPQFDAVVEGFREHIPETALVWYTTTKAVVDREREIPIPIEAMELGAVMPYFNLSLKSAVDGDFTFFQITFEGRMRFVSDWYCVKYDCRCEEVMLLALEDKVEGHGEDNDIEHFITVKNGGEVQAEHVQNPAGLVAALESQYPEFRQTLKRRYKEVKALVEKCWDEYEEKWLEEDDDLWEDEDPWLKALVNQGLPTPMVKQKKIGRNEPCPCESGKKYKKCCLRAKG